jgi:ParB-like chromosome segregation protein Spo0J
MSTQEYERHKATIAANGLRDPILIHDGQIVDGRHRYRACRELGIPPRYEEWDGQGSLLALVIDKNLARRHLSESQRALLAVRLKQEFETEARANMSRGAQGLANLPTLHSRDQAAQACNVSSRLVGTAEAVATRGAPELIAAVQRDAVAVSTAAELLELELEAQAEVVAQGPEAVRAKVKQLHCAKSKKKTRRTGAAAERPDAAASLPTIGAGDDLLPPPGWLESFPVRSQLANPANFDFLATTWWVAAALLPRFDPPYRDKARKSHAMSWRSKPMLLDLLINTEHPSSWTLCWFCDGRGDEEDHQDCPTCRGRGFLTALFDPKIPARRQTAPVARRSGKAWQPPETATGTNDPRTGTSETKPRPRRVPSRS